MSKIVAFRLPHLNAVRKALNPIYLILCACLLNTLLQISTAEKEWNSFSIYGVEVSYELVSIYCIYFFCFVMGSISCYFSLSKKHKESFFSINHVKLTRVLRFFLIVNFITFSISQYYMGAANIWRLYVVGGVSVQEINNAINNSPLGIHGVSILIGYCFIPVYGLSILSKSGVKSANINLLIVILKFIAFGKIQSLVCLFFAFMIFSKKFSVKKFVFFIVATLLLFIITRVLRNPELDLLSSGDFIFRFVGGYYLGSPVVNASYIIDKNLNDITYFFNWTVPQKLLPKTDITQFFPDTTSPIGLFGSTFLGMGMYGVIYLWLVGFSTQYMYLKQKESLSIFIFLPILIMTLSFSMMYNNFINTVFFIIPLMFSRLLCLYVKAKKHIYNL